MTLMAETVLTPTFDKDEFAKLVTQETSRLQILQQDPGYLAETGFNKVVFGEHPYSRPANGTPQQLGRISPEDLTQWWKTFARPDQSTLIFAGDITSSQAVKLANASLGEWKSGPLDKGPMLPDIPQPQPTQITLIDRPGSAQAQLHLGHIGITRRQQPDYFYGLVTGNYFGGSFNSRLNDAVRVKRGLTYGAHGGFSPLNRAGTFEISTFTKNESVVETLNVILEQIRQFQTVPPTEVEFKDTRSFLFGSFARNREMPQQVARDLWMMKSQDLSSDYFKRLFGTLENATPKGCTALTQKVIHPDRQSIVVVGDAAALKESLEKIAPVMVMPLQEETP
jgi:zinc protease